MKTTKTKMGNHHLKRSADQPYTASQRLVLLFERLLSGRILYIKEYALEMETSRQNVYYQLKLLSQCGIDITNPIPGEWTLLRFAKDKHSAESKAYQEARTIYGRADVFDRRNYDTAHTINGHNRTHHRGGELDPNDQGRHS